MECKVERVTRLRYWRMGGAWLGEKLGNVILSELAGIEKLANMDDPVAAALGLSPRKIIRDPSGENPFEKEDEKTDISKDSIISSNGSTNTAEGLDTQATYENNGGVLSLIHI